MSRKKYADWDVRLKSQLAPFARGIHILSQPIRNSPKDNLYPTELDLSYGDKVQEPMHSPYGDNWEVLWLGHCGVRNKDVWLTNMEQTN